MLLLLIGFLFAQDNTQLLDLSQLSPPPQLKVNCSDITIHITKQTAKEKEMDVTVNGTKVSIQRTLSIWQALSQTFKSEKNMLNMDEKNYIFDLKKHESLLSANKLPLRQDIKFSYYETSSPESVFTTTLRVTPTKSKSIYNVRELVENKSMDFRSLLKMKFDVKRGHYLNLNSRDNNGRTRTCRPDLQ